MMDIDSFLNPSITDHLAIEDLKDLLHENDIEGLKKFLIKNEALYDAERFRDQISDFDDVGLYEFIANKVCSAKNIKSLPGLDPCFNIVVQKVQRLGGDYLQLYDNHIASDSDSDIVSLSGELS